MKTAYAYILASRHEGTLYIGVTSDLVRRVHEHREGIVPGFSSKYKTTRLVWYEVHEDIRAALVREKQIKKWRRAWKIKMIEEQNPDWDDISR